MPFQRGVPHRASRPPPAHPCASAFLTPAPRSPERLRHEAEPHESAPDVRLHIRRRRHGRQVSIDLLLDEVELMVKPFDADALLRKVGELLGR